MCRELPPRVIAAQRNLAFGNERLAKFRCHSDEMKKSHSLTTLCTMRLSATAAASITGLSPFDFHWSLYPASYVVNKARNPIEIDGNIDKEVWNDAPWSEPFLDITGSSSTTVDNTTYTPALTRFKALYDEEYLYIAAVLHASDDFPTVAKFTERNSPIYQIDSDFEVFIDPDGCSRNYMELELNAINTVWNLLLDKPYSNGGREHSARVAKPGDEDYYEVYHQASATRVLSGTLNDNETQHGATWSVEIRWGFYDIYEPRGVQIDKATLRTPPPGTLLRVNFSRVELKGKVNWTWQKQMVWDPQANSFRGFIDMHMPDAWGYFVIGDFDDSRAESATATVEHKEPPTGELLSDDSTFPRDPSWPARLTAMHVYYALKFHHHQHHHYTRDLSKLVLHPDIVLMDQFHIKIHLSDSRQHFLIQLDRKDGGLGVVLRDDRWLAVQDQEASLDKASR